MSTAAAGGYEGGAGGKFRKKPFRKATPYDRPVTALRNPVEVGSNNGWLSKIVDPASRVITRSAQKFFSSVFRKRLPAPEAVPEADREPRNEPSETVHAWQNPFGIDKPVVNGNDNLSNHSENNGIDELEHILKQKTFTRAEIDHIIKLIRSRAVDTPAEDKNKRSEPSTSQLLADNHKLELANVSEQENVLDTRRLLGEASVPAANSRVLAKEIASPAELAKAYMGNIPSKVSPSTLGLRSQVLREELPLVSNVPFPRKSSGLSLVPRSSVRFAGVSGVSENGYQTPRSQGRSAIYGMVRTPYSRIHSAGKGIGTMEDGYAGQSTSSWILENNTLSTGKQVSKRRSSVLDNDIGSVGPIRRIRQKTNLMSSKSSGLLVPETPIPTPGTAFGSDVAQGSVSLTQKPLLLEQSNYNIPKMRLAEDGDNCAPGTSFASVPSQSSEMARKILQQLDKLVPSPKEKSAELKLDIAREKSPAKLSVSMLRGQALRSVEEVDSPKMLNNVQNSGSLNGVGGTSSRVTQDFASQKLDKVEENVPLRIAGSGYKFAPESNGAERSTVKKDAVLSFRTADSAISNSVVTPPQRKRAFQMSVDEDFLELDDDCYSTKDVHTAGINEILEDSAVEKSKAVATETVTVEKPPVSEIKSPASLTLNKSSDTGASDGPKVNENNPGFAVPVTFPSITVAQPATLSQSPPLFSNVVPVKETTVPVFNFGSKSIDSAPPFTFSSTSSFSESSVKSGAQTVLKLEASSSPATIIDSETETMTKAVESDKGGGENALKTGDLFGKHENAAFSSVSTSATSTIFSFSNSNLSNGSIAPSPSLFSVPAPPSLPVSTGSANVIFTSCPTTTAVATMSSLPATTATTAFSSAPIFQFGSSTTAAVAPSSSMSQPSIASSAESTDVEQKSKTDPPFGNLNPFSFGATSSPLTSTGSGIFGFSSVAPTSNINSSSSANNLSSNSFGAGTGPAFGSQTASGTANSPFTQSISSQLGSSTPSPTFGLSSSSTFSTGSSLFGSSIPSSKQFSSGSGFGQNSSTMFSTGSNPFSSASGTVNLFSSSSQPASSMFSPTFTTASSPTTGFSFGGSSTAGAANSSASSPATGLSFGVSSTAGGASASTLASGFSFGGSSTAGAATGSAPPMAFVSGIAASSGPFFSFTTATAAPSSASLVSSQPVFGAPNPSITFSSSPTNDQMSMEDSMAEDTIQASTPTAPTFGQPATTPSSGFMFNSAPSGSPFQFGAQQNLVAPQNLSPFQGSGNFDFAAAAGGSFSLGTGDKSNRRYIKPRRGKNHKK
ncbi:nuclear pore complex protein NUP1-like isoform X2 [Macadamia integrifolia]|uniref:nuclear pore complex protein NUP1-like isoform X2 n=1 Tax=Macadamia integrifolia TaxID=60698 RepID=UPI001C4FE63B|nr:nuclear pore complex protein NUP1-like isoform X2 [Macadamia integrifolia]